MRHLDLFSGIGGFALAATWVWGEEYENAGFCEIDDFCQDVLEKHWPDAPIHGDIKELTLKNYVASFGQPGVIDLLTGGFPYQPFSQAGKRLGTEDNRYLWPEMLRVIREFHPRWIIGENVGGFVTWNGGMVLEHVHADLEGEGYAVQAFVIPACALNAPHRRDRVWIVGHAEHARQYGAKDGKGSVQGSDGNAAGALEVREPARPAISWSDAPNPERSRLQGRGEESTRQHGQRNRDGREEGPNWTQDWPEVATRLCRMDDGLPRRLDRTKRLKALGNAIVPQIAAQIMTAIKETDTVAK